MTQSYIDPSKTNFEAFKDLPRDQPIHMLNLLQYPGPGGISRRP